MDALLEKTVGELVKENPARSRVFEKHRLDYCCGGKKRLGKALDEKGIPAALMIEEIARADAGPMEPRLDHLSPSDLTDRIRAVWHDPLREELPRLTALSAKVATRHGENWPFLVEIARTVEHLAGELAAHMEKEETILFPWVKAREAGKAPVDMSVTPLIVEMTKDHDEAGEALARLESLTGGFVPQEEACTSWRMLFAGLAELNEAMHRHVHAENEILFPWVVDALASREGASK